METLRIGEVAKRADVGVETIRFYERAGLIEEPPRRQSGYRQYPPRAVDRVRFIKKAKGLGFSLKEIKELLSLRAAPKNRCASVRKRAETKAAEIERKIADLRAMREALGKLIAECKDQGSVTECPILRALDSKG